jgi:hypothetical protein
MLLSSVWQPVDRFSLYLRVGVALSCPDDLSAVSETVQVPASETDSSTNNSVDGDNFRLEPDLPEGLLSGVLGRHYVEREVGYENEK